MGAGARALVPASVTFRGPSSGSWLELLVLEQPGLEQAPTWNAGTEGGSFNS